jgi:hypothetical protein
MGISLSTGSFSGFFWMLVTVYAVVVWAFRIRIYRKDLQFLRRHAPEVVVEALTRPQIRAARVDFSWEPSPNVRSALLGLHVIPCLWGPTCLWALGLGFLNAPAVGGLLGCGVVVSATITAWFCRRARNSLPDIELDVGARWRRSGAGAVITGGLLMATVSVAQLASRTVGPEEVLPPHAVAGATLLLGMMLLATANEVASAERNLRQIA